MRRIARWLLMTSALFVAFVIVATTLNGRPEIDVHRVQDRRVDSDFEETLRTANIQLSDMARAATVELAPPADNLAIARRLSLALVGSGLSLEEIRALESIPADKQIDWWTDYLLSDQRWADYFAERFSRAYVGTNDGPFLLFRKRKLNTWLAEQFRDEEVGYDQIVRAMLSSEGLWTDTPQVNFVTATMDAANEGRGDPIRLAGRTSRAFLAQRIDCLQCHDDFLDELHFGDSENPIGGTQQHFHELAAFFAGTALADPVFRGIKDDGQVYKFKYLGDSEPEEVQPAVPFQSELLPVEGKPRKRLAEWVTHRENRAFSRATVNRVWALLFSRALVEPVDNIPLDGSVPAVLDTLANDFSEHGFDLRRLIRLIAGLDAFQRDSRAEFKVTTEHENAWAVFPITQLRPEQVAGRLFQACKLTALDSSSSIFTRLKAFGDSQNFLKRFGDRGEDEFQSEAVTVTQRLVMMNGNLVAERTKVDLVNNAGTRIASLVADDQCAIELIFLSVLNRTPTSPEQIEFMKYLDGKMRNTRQRAFADICWAMINSTEFSWNH